MVNSGILGAATVALAATAVNAFPVPAGLSEGDGTVTSSTTSSSSSSHSSGTVICSSAAVLETYTYWEDAYAKAITSAIASACNAGPPLFFDIAAAAAAMSDFAEAYAAAVVEAAAVCVSSATGDAKVEGCAFAEASAYAYEFAFVEVFAEASAQAFTDHCTCGGDASAIDWAKGSIFQILEAEAFASVDVTACVTGTDFAEAYGYAACWADVYAKAHAASLSQAYVYSDYFSYCYAEVAAEAAIAVDSWVYESSECTFIEYALGLTDVNTDGFSGTRTTGLH